MKHRPPRSTAKSAEPAQSAAPDAPTLPPWKAFVVQFTHETRADGGVFAGRVEHLNSGHRARFKSAQDLVAALERLLVQLDEDRRS